MTVDQRRFCQEEGCSNELSINSLGHRKYCEPCNIIKRRVRIALSIAKRKQREKETAIIAS